MPSTEIPIRVSAKSMNRPATSLDRSIWSPDGLGPQTRWDRLFRAQDIGELLSGVREKITHATNLHAHLVRIGLETETNERGDEKFTKVWLQSERWKKDHSDHKNYRMSSQFGFLSGKTAKLWLLYPSSRSRQDSQTVRISFVKLDKWSLLVERPPLQRIK